MTLMLFSALGLSDQRQVSRKKQKNTKQLAIGKML